MKKILFIIIDGLGDEPIPALGNKTPLEAAKTPNLDRLARDGLCGILEPVYTTAIPTSEEGHFALFGYDPRIYKIRRGFFTAAGVGIKVRIGDVALRGNFGTVDENLNMIDRRAGRITKTLPLIKAIDGLSIDGVKFKVQEAGEYRLAVVLRGKGLSSNVSDGDPHYSILKDEVQPVKPLEGTREAAFTASLLNKFLKRTHQILNGHPLNKKRRQSGLLPANYILLRGASSVQKIPSFKSRYNLKTCCIAGKTLYQQIGNILGMNVVKVKGANGLINTNLQGKFAAALKSLKKYDFVFLHIKAADSLAEDGDFLGKTKFLEKIDSALDSVLKPLFRTKDSVIVVTGDHSTCSLKKSHCKLPLPLLIWGAGGNGGRAFCERLCREGKLGKIEQLRLMRLALEKASSP